MWVFFSIAALFIRVIIGNIETDTFPEKSKFQAEQTDDFDHEFETSMDNMSKEWNRESSAMEEDEKQNNLRTIISDKEKEDDTQNNRNIAIYEGTMPNLKTVSKRTEIASPRMRLYSPSQEKGHSIEDFQQLSEEKKSPLFNSWEDKSLNLYRSSPIQRPIRIPFNSWGGKRGKEDLELNIGPQLKRDKLLIDPIEEKDILSGNDVKRLAEVRKLGWKVPFNSWGGKRSRTANDFDRKQLALILNRDMERNDGNELTFFKDIPSNVKNIESAANYKRGTQSKNLKGRARFNSWGGKRNNPDYQTLPRITNETISDYTTGEELGGNNWLISMPDKRAQRAQLRRIGFSPWGGKRSSNIHVINFASDYSNVPAESSPGRKFYPWGG